MSESLRPAFTQVILGTGADGGAFFREEHIDLPEGTARSMLSAPRPCTAIQLRHSPVGFRSEFHCTTTPQWVFILEGEMQIGLQHGSSRTFMPGEHFHSADLLPPGAAFDPALHGHWSWQRGAQPLVTLFVRT